MELEFLTLNFSDMFFTGITVVILGFVSICLFFWFKGSNDKINGDSIVNQTSSSKKKLKRKINASKLNKQNNNNNNNDNDEIVEKSNKCKHIEIKSSPEIFEDSNREIKPHLFVSPSKPILRKVDDEILLVDEENFHEATWSRIPKDEIEVHRSRQSSVVSESRSIGKEEMEETSSKLSRGQKKRLKVKLKTIEMKSGENKINLSAACSNSNEEFNCVEDNESISNKLNLTKNKKKSNTKSKNCPSNSTESSLGNEKLLSSSSLELEDKSLWETMNVDYKEESNNYEINNVAPYGNHSDDNEFQTLCGKFKTENKDLKQEIHELKQKLNDLSIMSATIVNLKKENEIYLKKQVDLERTCTAIQKELTNSLQKMNSAENRIMRMNTERNQQISYFENEIHKCNNKISILEADLRSKTTDNENLKMNVEQIRHLVSDKEQLLQNQNTELSILNEQCYKTRVDYQEIELTANNITKKYKELENQNQKLLDENQKIKFQLELTKKENHKEFEKYKIQIQNKERDQNSLISCLQYQIDEFQKEKQLSMFNSELEELREENEKLKNMRVDRNNSCPSIPVGFELIEIDKIKQFTTNIIDGNQRLKEKCEQYNSLLYEKSETEALLLEKNSNLEKDYSKLNRNLEEHLNEIVNLRTCIEKLQLDLSKNCENNIDDMKIELDEKCETLRKTEEILTKLQVSVEDEEMRWKDLLSERIVENEKLENELTEKNLVISNQNKKITELTSILQSTNYSQMDSTLNGSLSVE